MKKIIEKIKNSKKLILGILIGALTINLIEFVVTLAENSVSSDIVLYNSSTGKKNVKDAIDELYTMASTHCPDKYNCYLKPTWVDNDKNGTVSEGDLLTYETESFYVISNDEDIIKLLPKYNLIKTTTNTLQQTSADVSYGILSSNSIGFSNSNYWQTGASSFDKGLLYDSKNNLYQYVEAYKTKLKNLGVNVIDATLISKDEAEYLVKTKKYPWASNQSYWTGNAASISTIYTVRGYGNNSVSSDSFLYSDISTGGCVNGCVMGSGQTAEQCQPGCRNVLMGIRPVIIIPKP